jgi:hypothetical protein
MSTVFTPPPVKGRPPIGQEKKLENLIKPIHRLKRRKSNKIVLHGYRAGGEGMGQWCDDHACVPIYPEGSDIAIWTPLCDLPDTVNPATGKSYKSMWDAQKEMLKEALKMENGRFVYRLIVLCWMRGEGKSLLACLIQLWKFFNWPRQQIMLGANSKDQVKFVHFDIMRDIIINSPKLAAQVGQRRNIQEKEIRLKDSVGDIRSIIRSISSFSGIVSNITGYTFSEIFDMKNPKFFTQLDGSIRNIPNALGVIDSTVSAKTHILYSLFSNYTQGKTTTVFFSYRYSKEGKMEDYWNPHMDEAQLTDYRVKFMFGDFERYFLNLWSAGTQKVFTDEMVEVTKYIGYGGELLNSDEMLKQLEHKNHLIEVMTDVEGKGFADGSEETAGKIDQVYSLLTPVETVYRLTDRYGHRRPASIDDLMNMTNLFDTDWVISAGLDYGDPYAVRGLARTIVVVIAKGLPGSKSNPHIHLALQTAPKYLYSLLVVEEIPDHSGDTVKKILEEANEEYDGIDVLCSERYGAWDMEKWCEDRDVEFQPIFPTYDRQRDAFKQVLEAAREGRLKCPPLSVPGSKKEDIRDEEMGVFEHDQEKKWFGSIEKFEKYGIQDDFMFALGWGIYGPRLKGIDDFRIRRGAESFGFFIPNRNLHASYA